MAKTNVEIDEERDGVPVVVYFDERTYRVLQKYHAIFGDDLSLSTVINSSMRNFMIDFFSKTRLV